MQTWKTHHLSITVHIIQKKPSTDSIQNKFKIKGNKEKIDVERLKEDLVMPVKQEIQAVLRNGFTCREIKHLLHVHFALKNEAGLRLAGPAPMCEPHKCHGLGGLEPFSRHPQSRNSCFVFPASGPRTSLMTWQ